MLIAPVKTAEELKETCRKSSALHVRSQPVIRWALFLTRNEGAAQRIAASGLTPPQLNHDMLQVLHSRPDGPPEVLVQNAVHASTEDEAEAILNAFHGDREGYAAARAGRPEDPAADVAEEPLAAWTVPDASTGVWVCR